MVAVMNMIISSRHNSISKEYLKIICFSNVILLLKMIQINHHKLMDPILSIIHQCRLQPQIAWGVNKTQWVKGLFVSCLSMCPLWNWATSTESIVPTCMTYRWILLKLQTKGAQTGVKWNNKCNWDDNWGFTYEWICDDMQSIGILYAIFDKGTQNYTINWYLLQLAVA